MQFSLIENSTRFSFLSISLFNGKSRMDGYVADYLHAADCGRGKESSESENFGPDIARCRLLPVPPYWPA
jgi:hypothetical protein